MILEHLLQRSVKLPYLVYALAQRWRAWGHRVLVHHGAEGAPEGDLAIMNVDLTRLPDSYRALAARYPRLVNGAVHDVSKNRFSQDLLASDSDWPGPVIVKTERNYGGRPERLLRAVAARAGVSCDIPEGPLLEGYPVFDSLRAVPEAIWREPGLVVERFVPEADSRGFYLRVWIFLGARESSGRWRASAPIIKGEQLLEREDVPVPDELRRWREALGFDYGKFDYVRHDGRFVLLDANRTPSFTPAVGALSACLSRAYAGSSHPVKSKRGAAASRSSASVGKA